MLVYYSKPPAAKIAVSDLRGAKAEARLSLSLPQGGAAQAVGQQNASILPLHGEAQNTHTKVTWTILSSS